MIHDPPQVICRLLSVLLLPRTETLNCPKLKTELNTERTKVPVSDVATVQSHGCQAFSADGGACGHGRRRWHRGSELASNGFGSAGLSLDGTVRYGDRHAGRSASAHRACPRATRSTRTKSSFTGRRGQQVPPPRCRPEHQRGSRSWWRQPQNCPRRCRRSTVPGHVQRHRQRRRPQPRVRRRARHRAPEFADINNNNHIGVDANSLHSSTAAPAGHLDDGDGAFRNLSLLSSYLYFNMLRGSPRLAQGRLHLRSASASSSPVSARPSGAAAPSFAIASSGRPQDRPRRPAWRPETLAPAPTQVGHQRGWPSERRPQHERPGRPPATRPR